MATENLTKSQSNKYALFSRVQTLFYTSPSGFDELTNYELKQCAFMLITSIGKGFSNFADMLINTHSPAVKAIESPEIIRAVQRKMYENTPYKGQLPPHVYYKNLEDKSQKAKATKKVTAKGDEFSQDIQAEICRILMLDTKDYQTLKYTPRVQYLGNQILGEFMKKASKTSKTKKR